MCGTRSVLALLALYVGLAHCFSWDIVVGEKNELKFYNNGMPTRTADIPSAEIASITYDAAHNRVLFSDNGVNYGIWSFGIATNKIEALVRCKADYAFKFAYDPVTDTLFWIRISYIYALSLKPGSNNTGGNVIVNNYAFTYDIAVDSCEGFIYWTTTNKIMKAQFDGSNREVVINSFIDYYRPCLAIDQQGLKMYWINSNNYKTGYNVSIISADLNGTNKRTLHSEIISNRMKTITLAKDFIYWRSRSANTCTVWQFPKNPLHNSAVDSKRAINIIEDTLDDSFLDYFYCNSIAANYKLEDQPQGSRTCEPLRSLLPREGRNVTTDVSLFCVHGTKVTGESVCKCTQGYTGERCNISICQNYCLHGDCSVSDEQPKCRCNAGYSGKRCEVDACHKHCLNDGVCSLDAESQPVCQCTGDYEGDRCEVSVSVFLMKCFRVAPTLSSLRDILNTDVAPVTVDKGVLQLLSENNGACFVNES